MTTVLLRRRLAELIQQATNGRVTAADVLVDGVSLGALGLDSLGLLRLVDAVEAEYDVEIDFGAGRISPDSLDSFVDFLAARGVRTDGPAA
jgi:acyl carrier protein